ncbi:MAG: DegT/DnrJ/EryC1/StrS family aminotransferase [Patescibacteria group bacterium]|jgi:L-glutamine:2-deoxy-scyllo-inosose/3-amino-2,3-dideoxy-scyllo-inosose aminotransferase
MKLAINGGKPVAAPGKKWPRWPRGYEADVRRLAAITRSGKWSYDGPYEWEFARRFAAFLGAKYGACCANGTVAIQLALEALDIGAFDEVIVPGMTWQATAAACIDVNAVPILVDVEPSTWCIDVDKVKAAITPKTKAVIAVHLYGCMPDMASLQRLCKKRHLRLIEDCAHQHGSLWEGKGVGTLSDVGCFSFQESKVLSSGEGGYNTCQTRKMFERLYSLRNCGRPFAESGVKAFGLEGSGKPRNTVQSGNCRLTEWQAAILLGGLSRLPAQVAQRDDNAQYLNGLLEQIPGVLTMYRRPQVTRQSYFNYAFRLATEDLGIGNRKFCRALNAELGFEEGQDGSFEPPYDSLNKCDLYKPWTKRRHHLDNEYWDAINPKRFDLSVCKEANEHSGVVVHHAILMGPRSNMDLIAKAVQKVVDNIGEVQRLAD